MWNSTLALNVRLRGQAAQPPVGERKDEVEPSVGVGDRPFLLQATQRGPRRHVRGAKSGLGLLGGEVVPSPGRFLGDELRGIHDNHFRKVTHSVTFVESFAPRGIRAVGATEQFLAPPRGRSRGAMIDSYS